jgi:hypothetical protein
MEILKAGGKKENGKKKQILPIPLQIEKIK